MSPSGVHIKKPVALVLVGLVISVVLFYKFGWLSSFHRVSEEKSDSKSDIVADSLGKDSVDDADKDSHLKLDDERDQEHEGDIDDADKENHLKLDDERDHKGDIDLDTERKFVADPDHSEEEKELDKQDKKMDDADKTRRASWHVKDFVDIPQNVLDGANSVTVKEATITVDTGKEKVEIFYRECLISDSTPKLDVLFLHGQAFTSKNWEDIKALQLVAASGYHAVAVDLPGYGSSKPNVSDRDYFLEHLINALKLDRPVIVSPSMSGTFSLPFLFYNGAIASEHRSRGFIPVAPVDTGSFRQQMRQSKIPALIICGENDKMIGPRSTEDLSWLPDGEVHIIKDAGHAAYMNKPEEFHKLVYNFLLSIANH